MKIVSVFCDCCGKKIEEKSFVFHVSNVSSHEKMDEHCEAFELCRKCSDEFVDLIGSFSDKGEKKDGQAQKKN